MSLINTRIIIKSITSIHHSTSLSTFRTLGSVEYMILKSVHNCLTVKLTISLLTAGDSLCKILRCSCRCTLHCKDEINDVHSEYIALHKF